MTNRDVRFHTDAHASGALAPFRQVLLAVRAKHGSYEEMAVILERHGVRVSPDAIGDYCRRNFTRSEVELARQAVMA